MSMCQRILEHTHISVCDCYQSTLDFWSIFKSSSM